jgi:UDP-N-acetylglucosamine acyltransferase
MKMYIDSKRGSGNFIHPTAIVHGNVVLGDNNYIGPYCIIGEPGEHKGHFHEELASRDDWKNHNANTVRIGNGNTFTKQVTIDAGTVGDTIVGNENWMLKNAHIGHDAVLHNNITLSCNAVVGGHCAIDDGCNFGLGAVMHQYCYMPKDCMVGMNTTVTKRLVPEECRKYAGSPARDIGPNTNYHTVIEGRIVNDQG